LGLEPRPQIQSGSIVPVIENYELSWVV
jgi:hypothetical protein